MKRKPGRPKAGRKAYLIRMKPETKTVIDSLAGKKSVGEFLEAVYGK